MAVLPLALEHRARDPGGLPIVGAAAALIPAGEAAKEVSSVLTGDLVTIKGQVFRAIRRRVPTGELTPTGRPAMVTQEVLVPVDVEAHVNPLSIIIAAGVGLAGVLAGVVAWHGVRVGVPAVGEFSLFKGLKDTTMGRDLNRIYEKFMVARRIRASGGEVVEARTDLTPAEIEEVLLRVIGDAECQLLNREWAKAKRRGDTENAARFLQQAKDGGCPWAKAF